MQRGGQPEGNKWVRELRGLPQHRAEVRPSIVYRRNYTAKAYLLDSARPDDVILVDLDDPTTCEFGFSTEPGSEWTKEIAIIIDPECERPINLAYPGYIRGYVHLDFDLQLAITTSGGTDSYGISFGLAANDADFAGGIISYNAKPGVDSAYFDDFEIDIDREIAITSNPAVNAWNAEVDGAGPLDAASGCLFSKHGEYESYVNMWKWPDISPYGYRAFVYDTYNPDGHYVELTMQLKKWEFLCD